MANQYVNKVVNGETGDVIIDISGDTLINASQLVSGVKAHTRAGAPITGTNTNDANTQDANATASQILDGATAYVQGAKVTGTMTNNGAVHGTIGGPVELRARGTLAGTPTLQDTITFEGALNHEGCRLKPEGHHGTIISKKSMTLPGEVYLEIDATMEEGGQPSCGQLVVEGDLTLKGTNHLTVNLDSPDGATYAIATCSGKLTCDVSKLTTRGLDGLNYDLNVVNDKQLVLTIHASRAPQQNVVWTGSESNTWNYKAQNFQLAGSPTAFVASSTPRDSAPRSAWPR